MERAEDLLVALLVLVVHVVVVEDRLKRDHRSPTSGGVTRFRLSQMT